MSWEGSGDEYASGAYLFRPSPDKKYPFSSFTSGKLFKGKVITYIMVSNSSLLLILKLFSENLTTTILINNKKIHEGFELETFLEPLEDSARKGKEVVLLITSKNLQNGNTFYTDSNGYFMEKRVLNQRETYEPKLEKLYIPGNYYPITTAMIMEDSNRRLTIMIDRAQGVTSFKNGQAEMMIHRVCRADDSKGVAEILRETERNSTQLIRVNTFHRIILSVPSRLVLSYLTHYR